MAVSIGGSGVRWWVIVGVTAGLWACASPPDTPGVRPVVGIAPPTRIAAPAPPPPAPPTAAPAAPEATPDMAEAPGVAARFPDPPVEYRTPAFQPGHTGFTSNAELRAALQGLAGAASTGAPPIRLLSLGSSQTGVPLEALLFTRLSDADPAAILRSGRPTVLLVGQQHGDEPAGSEALLVVAQELAGARYAAWLERLDVLVLPRDNPAGARDNGR